mgnify:CR=1 FL=1
MNEETFISDAANRAFAVRENVLMVRQLVTLAEVYNRLAQERIDLEEYRATAAPIARSVTQKLNKDWLQLKKEVVS